MRHVKQLDRHNDTASVFGSLLQAKREAAGLSQTKLAALLGVSRPYIGRLERGEYTDPSPRVLAQIAVHLPVGITDLYAAAGYIPSCDLPSFGSYLHAKHPDWPQPIIAELEDFYEFVKDYHSL